MAWPAKTMLSLFVRQRPSGDTRKVLDLQAAAKAAAEGDPAAAMAPQ